MGIQEANGPAVQLPAQIAVAVLHSWYGRATAIRYRHDAQAQPPVQNLVGDDVDGDGGA